MNTPSREDTLIDFLKGLRIILSNALAYPLDHPYFIKSVKVFHQKIDAAFNLLKPLKIGITQNSLFLDDKYWDKLPLYTELAALFHYRKIKSIEFKEGLSHEELINFLESVSKPAREILRRGGMKSILNKLEGSHVAVEELDYSELLKVKGEELKDVWVYLFKTAVEQKDPERIESYYVNFKEILANFKGKDLVDDKDLRENIHNFLLLLKEKEKEKFLESTKKLLGFSLKDRTIRAEASLDELKGFFNDLDKESVADVFLNAVCEEENYDALSLGVLFKLFDEESHKRIASVLSSKIKDSDLIKTNPKAVKRIRELFSATDESQILPFYHRALSWLSEADFSTNDFTFDRGMLYKNYCLLLLNLLAQEKDGAVVDEIANSIKKESANLIKERDFEYLRFLYMTIEEKLSAGLPQSNTLLDLKGEIALFIENAVFQDIDSDNFDFFIEQIINSSAGIGFYLKKIFEEGMLNPTALKLMFKFFPSDLGKFYDKLKERSSDIDFLAMVIRTLENIDTDLSIEALKNIFFLSHNMVKTEVLKAMSKLNNYDGEFLFSVLESSDNLLKKEALLCLQKHGQPIKRALDILFSQQSIFGRNNSLLIERINIIEDVELKEAKSYLESFSKKRFFWNSRLRERAKEVLRKWDDGKH